MNWPFEDDPRTAAFTLKAIVFDGAPILVVMHDAEGDWQFLDDATDATTENAALVALREIAERDPSILELADLPPGWMASRRGPGEPWARRPNLVQDGNE